MLQRVVGALETVTEVNVNLMRTKKIRPATLR